MQFRRSTNSHDDQRAARWKAMPTPPLVLSEKSKKRKGRPVIFFINPKYEECLYSTRASIIIINEAQELKQPIGAALIRVAGRLFTRSATLLDKYQQIQRQQLSGIQQPVLHRGHRQNQ